MQIQALRTELNTLKNARLGNGLQQFQSQLPAPQQNQQTNQNGNGYFIEPWRKSKTKGDTCFVDGKQWWWCPEHKRQNDFDGLYVTHQPGQGHQNWLERKRRNKRNREASRQNNGNSDSTSTSTSGINSGGPQLMLNDQMRQELLTHHGFSKLQMQAIEDAARMGN